MENNNETVILEIEGTSVECNKKLLIKNSDYFSAMLTGNFKESSQKIIKIQNVDLKSFNTIILLLWDENYIIDDKELHLILQAACMLQFNTIKQLCISRIMEILSPSNCMTIWKTTELLDISPLWLKAKCMALEEFNTIICDTSIFDLNLHEICSYLGHLYLNNKNEFTVFQTIMNWWYENQEMYKNDQKAILKLLNCIDFKSIQENEIKEMQTYPDVANDKMITSVLNCLIALKANNDNLEEFSEEHKKYAKHFLNCNSRKRPVMPCVLLESDFINKSCTSKKFNIQETVQKTVLVYDKYLRKRLFHEVSDNPQDKISILIYDAISKSFKILFQIDMDKVKDLAGFKLISYKEFVFLFGGEYLIGAGNWNCNFWAYDTFKRKWTRKNVLPQGRRHFETIIVDNCIFIIGGVGKFRVIQENLLWYDFKADKWSSVIPLPSPERQLKCCSFHDKLFVIYLSERRAFFFDKEKTNWRRISIQIDKEIIGTGEFTVFSDENYLYIKGMYLITFKLEKDELLPIKQIEMKSIKFAEIESILCNDTVYTLYKCLSDHYEYFFTFESFNLKTETLEYIFRNRQQQEDPLKIDNLSFYLTSHTKLFCVNYYSLVKDDIFINNENDF